MQTRPLELHSKKWFKGSFNKITLPATCSPPVNDTILSVQQPPQRIPATGLKELVTKCNNKYIW
jgi:hypothetical protein